MTRIESECVTAGDSRACPNTVSTTRMESDCNSHRVQLRLYEKGVGVDLIQHILSLRSALHFIILIKPYVVLGNSKGVLNRVLPSIENRCYTWTSLPQCL